MMINSLRELKKLVLMCRENGVQSIKIDNIEFHLGDVPSPVAPRRSSMQAPVFVPGSVTEDTKILTDELTEDQLLFYSSNSDQAHS